MRNAIAVTLAAFVLAACASHTKEARVPGLGNEASTNTGTGNTRGQSAAAGASANSESRKESAGEAAR
jgi:hypothetical protein